MSDEKAAPATAGHGQKHAKCFIPLESNPELFTELSHTLGVSPKFQFQDVLSIDDSDLMAFVPRPVLALILIFSTSTPAYEQKAAAEEIALQCHKPNDIVWFKQTIHNACGLYAILHAVANSIPEDQIASASTLSQILTAAKGKSVEDTAKVLEQDADLEAAHSAVAVRGDTAPPEPEDEVDYHYICLVKDSTNELYELDGERKGPIHRCTMQPEEDLLSDKALDVVRTYMKLLGEDRVEFGIMSLTEDNDQ